MKRIITEWDEIIEYYRNTSQITNISFITWIKPLKIFDVEDDIIFLLTSQETSKDYLEKHFLDDLKKYIEMYTRKEIEIRLMTESEVLKIHHSMRGYDEKY